MYILVGLAMTAALAPWLLSCRSPNVNRVSDTLALSHEPGRRLYQAHCLACHGSTGRGDGPAAIALKIRPRAFSAEPFRYVSTIEGIATHDDLIQSIRSGRRIGQMPANPQLTDDEVLALAKYVQELNRQGWVERLSREAQEEDELTAEDIDEIATERVTPGDPIVVVRPGPSFHSDTAVGRKLYLAACASCHGPTGRGDGLDTPLDERGRPIRVRDLTSGQFRGGDTLVEVFKRIRCGVPGTPMPAQDKMSDDEVWQLVYYVQFLARRRW